MPFVSSLEKRLFRLAAICLLLIYVSIFFVRPIADFLRDNNSLRLAVALCFLSVAIVVVEWRRRSGAGAAEWALMVAFAAVYLVAMLRLRVPEERFHLIEYGLLGGLVYAWLRERRRARLELGMSPAWLPPAVTAVILTVAAGWIDEAIQGLLPARFYDLKDVFLNGLAGLLAVAFLVALRRLRGPEVP